MASVVWVGVQIPRDPQLSAEERQALEEVRTPPAPGENPPPAEEPANQVIVPEYALWAPGTKIQTTDHFPQPGESFIAQSCTVAFSFGDTDGRNYAVTAGHCGREGNLVWPTNAAYASDYHHPAGHFIYSGLFSDGADGTDIGIIEITDPERYMEVVGDPIPTGIGKDVPPLRHICKTGGTTGYTCGKFLETQRVQIVDTIEDAQLTTFGDIAGVCVSPGDSGGPVFSELNGRAVIVGVVSGTEAGRADEECYEGMENPKRMSYSNTEQLFSVISRVVPQPAWVTQTW